jgi:hypothetical protein
MHTRSRSYRSLSLSTDFEHGTADAQRSSLLRPVRTRGHRGERVRDKDAASKRKGLWVGGSIPLGYRSVNKKPQVDARNHRIY